MTYLEKKLLEATKEEEDKLNLLKTGISEKQGFKSLYYAVGKPSAYLFPPRHLLTHFSNESNPSVKCSALLTLPNYTESRMHIMISNVGRVGWI